MSQDQGIIVNMKEVCVKKALRKGDFASSMFLGMYSASPYMGCSHGCLYCDGRAEKYHLEGDFEKNITIRKNLPDLMEGELYRLRERGPVHFSSGISDIYQPCEKEYSLMARCSEILSETSFPVSVLTKSSLVLRDLNNWKKVNSRGGFLLQMTLTTLDEDVIRMSEPGASSAEKRIETIQAFKDAGCSVGIYMMPLLPGLSDDNRSVEALLTKLRELNVDYIIPGELTLRPGRQKEAYFQMIRENRPHLEREYHRLFQENRYSGVPLVSYRKELHSRLDPLFQGVCTLPPHYLYRNTMPVYCELLILLQHMFSLYKRKSSDLTPLKEGYVKIHDFLKKEKSAFNRKRSLPGDEVDNILRFFIQTGGLEDLLKNERLTDFITSVVVKRKVFNYQTLKFEDFSQ